MKFLKTSKVCKGQRLSKRDFLLLIRLNLATPRPNSRTSPHRRERGEIGGVYLPSHHITNLLVMVARVKGESVHPRPHQVGLLYQRDGMYARKCPWPFASLFVLSRMWLRSP
jgi:hypothetical protein